MKTVIIEQNEIEIPIVLVRKNEADPSSHILLTG